MAEVLQTMMMTAVRPWESLDASGYTYYEGRWVRSDESTYDSQEQIELCMRCPFADECHDCVTAKARTRRKPFARKKVKRK